MHGKVVSAMHHGHSAIKSGLARAHGIYVRGMHIASRVSDLYNVSKRVAAIALPEIEQYAPGAVGKGAEAFGALDLMRDKAGARFEDVQDRIRDHGRAFQRVRDAVPEVRPYLS